MTKIKKAVIPAAGLGTRFLPYTKTKPKEMQPLLNKPTIHYVVEEASQRNRINIHNNEFWKRCYSKLFR